MFFSNFFKRRSFASIIKDVKQNKDLERSIGLMQLIFIGIGAIIGAGIFVLLGTAAAENAGPAITLSFIIVAIACICVGLCYSELSSAIPTSGSVYSFAYLLLGEGLAWLTLSMIIMTYFLGAAAVASGWSGYMVSTLMDFGIYFPPELSNIAGHMVFNKDNQLVQAIINMPAVILVTLLTLLLMLGTDLSLIINSVIVVIKVAALGLFIIVGACYIDPNNWIPYIPENTGKFGEFGLSGILGGASVIFFALNGFDTIATAAQETKKPQRDIPIAIIVSILFCAVIYMMIATILTGLTSYTELGVPQPIAVALANIPIRWLPLVIQIGAIAALTSVTLVLIFSGVRIIYTAVHDGLLPRQLGKCSKKYHTPYIITMIAGLVIAILASTVPINALSKLANLGTMITFMIICYCNIYMRKKYPGLKRQFTCPFMPWIPIIAIVLILFTMYSLPSEIFYYTIVWVFISYCIYFIYSFFRYKNIKKA